MNRYAWFDTLSITSHLQPVLGAIAKEELHLMSYLACLLWLYSDKPVSEWGYWYAATQYGAPYGPDLDGAIDELVKNGLLSKRGLWYSLSIRGQEEYEELLQLSDLASRNFLFEATKDTLRIYPVGITRCAISQDPLIRSANTVRGKHLLFGEETLDLLYEDFQTIKTLVGAEASGDLLVPATIWIDYFSRKHVLTEQESQE